MNVAMLCPRGYIGETESEKTASINFSNAFVALNFKELGELCLAKCIVHLLLLATGPDNSDGGARGRSLY